MDEKKKKKASKKLDDIVTSEDTDKRGPDPFIVVAPPKPEASLRNICPMHSKLKC